MILRHWREADPGLLRSCYDIEQRYWRRELAWDTTWTWTTIEQARVSRGLPGLLAFDESGRLQGWAFYVLEGAMVHLGGLVAESPGATAALLDRVLDAATDVNVDRAACFILDRAVDLAPALTTRGFSVERYLYLSRPLAAVAPLHAGPLAPSPPRPVAPPQLRTPAPSPPWLPDRIDRWRESDRSALAALLQAAYPGEAGEPFAPNGTPEEWTAYVTGLVEQAGCGVLDRAATRILRDGDGVQAVALMTQVAPATAHMAQVAVRPDCRGRGLASQLVREAAACAANAGKRELTLLVGETNLVARRMYASMGFVPRATFVAARTPSIRRCVR